MNRKALQKLSYGVYLVTTSYNGKPYGCVANSAMQITSAPAQIAVSRQIRRRFLHGKGRHAGA